MLNPECTLEGMFLVLTEKNARTAYRVSSKSSAAVFTLRVAANPRKRLRTLAGFRGQFNVLLHEGHVRLRSQKPRKKGETRLNG